MRNANLVADEMKSAGFRSKVSTSNSVIVSLTNRKVGTMEVETAMNARLDGRIWNVQSITNGVLVSW